MNLSIHFGEFMKKTYMEEIKKREVI